SSQSEHVKTAHQEEPAKQKAGVIAAPSTSADNGHTVADDLQQLSVSGIIVRFIGYPYLTLQDEDGKLM
ncbi:MAG: hypothetical protein ACXV8J_12335, partial [Methylobacter sp.]